MMPAVSADLVGDIIGGIQSIVPFTQTVANEPAVIPDTIPVISYIPAAKLPEPPRANYEYKSVGASPLDFLFGTSTKNSETEVIVNGKSIARLPKNSPLANMIIHTDCLPYQYGSINWYSCEVQYQ
jgi:hypothetical protein